MQKVTDNQFTEAHAKAKSYRECMRLLGLNASVAWLKTRARRLGLSDAHMVNSTVGKVSDAQFVEAVRASRSVEHVRRNLGLCSCAKSLRVIRRRIERLGLDTSHFGPWDPSSGGGGGYKALPDDVVFSQDRLLGKRTSGSVLRRALVQTGTKHQCAGCGAAPEWQGQPLTLQVNHKNGDPLDNSKDNLELLCPNCHSQTPTFCGRNNKRVLQ